MGTQDLDQSAIDSLFAAAAVKPALAAINFQQRKSLTPEQMGMLIAESKVFGRSVSSRLSSWLSADVKISMVAAERILFSDQLEMTDLNGMHFGEARFASSQPALVGLDFGFVAAVVNLVLGGPADAPQPSERRELTTIDAAVMNVMLEAVWTELNQVWRSRGLEATHKGEVDSANVGKVFAQTEYLLVFSYEMKIGDVEGALQVALSTTVADTLLRELGRQDTSHAQSAEARLALQKRLVGTTHRTHLRSPAFSLRVGDLLGITPGMVLQCGVEQSSPAHFGIIGGKVWKAVPAQRDGRIVAQLFE